MTTHPACVPTPCLPADLETRGEELRRLIRRVKIDPSFCYEIDRLLDLKIRQMAKECRSVLDFGKSSRRRFDFFARGQIETADINRFDGYPDHLCDLCDATTLPGRTYDGIVCNAILEHVYDPFAAVNNIHNLLRDAGMCLCYVPFLYRYHAPDDLVYQDYYRYTRDGLAYLFRNFGDVTLYPVRGRSSSALNILFKFWKTAIEPRFPWACHLADRVLGGVHDPLQTSGYIVWAIK